MIYKNQVNPPAPTVPAPNPVSTPAISGPIGPEQLALISNFRQLWMQLAIWSRSLIVSISANLGDVQMIYDRLMFLPETFSGVLDRYFEPRDIDSFRELLQEHISIEAELFDAEKNNNDQTVNRATVSLYDNANRMADYLASINPYWSAAEWRNLMTVYIQTLLADLVARMAGGYAKEIEIFDDLQTQAIALSDYMAQGMLRRFVP